MDLTHDIEFYVENGHNIAILGQAGTGKSFIVKKLYHKLKSSGRNVKITATTGIASTVLPEASTVHSFFGLQDGRYSVDQLIQKVCDDDNFNAVKARILETETVFIDEVSMLSLKLFTDIDALCRAVRNNDTPFGGMQVILSGDFFQLKPVPNSYGDNGEYIFPAIKHFHKFVLQKVHRQTEGRECFFFKQYFNERNEFLASFHMKSFNYTWSKF